MYVCSGMKAGSHEYYWTISLPSIFFHLPKETKVEANGVTSGLEASKGGQFFYSSLQISGISPYRSNTPLSEASVLIIRM